MSGTVTDAGGKPVEGAIVRLTPTTLPWRATSCCSRARMRAASFAIYGAPAGECRVVGRHPDFAPAISPP